MLRQHWTARVPILYATLAVYQGGLLQPFNDWTPQHVRQGFSWRSGSVSFQTLDTENITDLVVVDVQDTYTPPSAARRIIKVPFEVGDTGMEVTSPVMDAWPIPIPKGRYDLFYAIEPADTEKQDGQGEAWSYHLTLVPTSQPGTAEIIRADNELEPPGELLMEARPAG